MASVESYTPLRPLGPFLLLAQDADGTPVVLKRLPEDRAADPAARHAFRLEAWRAGQLEGPRFTRAQDPATAWQERPFYTMPYAEGPPATLVPPAEVAAYVRQLADALAALHERGWVHAALEPTQLRRTEVGLVVVGYGNLTPHGQRARRPGAGAYMAPEQRAGQPLDGRTDLYALGALIHFWLTGEAGQELDLLDMVNDPLADLGRWLLAPKPGDRPPDALTLLATLDRVIPGARRPEPIAPRAPWLAPPQLPAPSLQPFDLLLARLDAGEGVGRRLEAPPGAGKSTWLERAAERARAAGWPVLRARGQGIWAAPLAPWRTLWAGFQALATERQPGLVERYRHRLAAIAEPAAEPASGLASPWLADVAGPRQVAALAEFLAAMAPPGLVVVLDDWDQADEASRDLLAAVVERASDAPILWLGAGGGPFERLPLPPLSQDDGLQLVKGLLATPPPQEAAEALVASTGAHPWHLQALVHAWVDQGEVKPGLGQLPPAATWPVQHQAVARLAASVVPEPSAWTVGAYAWLLGPHVAFERLDQLGEDPLALMAGLDALLTAGILVRDATGYHFAHPAFGQIYERVLDPLGQARAHRRVVEGAVGVSTRAAWAPVGERVALARHAMLAEAPDLLASLALDAARLALAHGALETARTLLDEGLVTLPGDHPARGSYMALMGEIDRRQNRLPDAVTLLEGARELLPGGPERQAVALALADALSRLGLHDRAVGFWREAAGHAQGLGDMDALAFALAGLCQAQAALGHAEDALESGEAAVGVAAEAAPQPRAMAMAALGALLAAAGRERQAEGIALMQRAAALFEAEGDHPRLLNLHQRLAEAELARGELFFARDTALRTRELAGPFQREAAARGGLLYAQALWALGDHGAAELAATTARQEAEALGAAALAAEAWGLEGLARPNGEGVGMTAEALQRLPAAALPAARARLWLWHAETLMAARQFPEAANALYEAQAPIRAAHLADLAGQRTYLLGAWAAQTGDRERARQELRATLAQPNQWLVARAALLLGQLALEAGARTEAGGWLEQARRGALALGAERLATEAEHLEKGLVHAGEPDDESPQGAATRLEALFEEAKQLLPRLTSPAEQLAALETELAAARALNGLWEKLFDAMLPRDMAVALVEAVFQATPARRAFALGKDLTPLAAWSRSGELPYELGMVDAPRCRRAMEAGGVVAEAGDLAVPMATPRRVIGALYVVGVGPEAGAALKALAAAAALAIERLVLPPPGEA